MSKVLKALRKCDERLDGCDVIIAIVPNALHSKGIAMQCWDVVNLLGKGKAYEEDGIVGEDDWLLARCYSESELREFLRNYGRE